MRLGAGGGTWSAPRLTGSSPGFSMPDEVPKAVALRVDLDRRINFAMQQNDVPVVKALHIENPTATPLRDLAVHISVEPAFAQPWSTRVAAVGEDSTYTIDAVDLELSPGFLGDLTERLRGRLHAELRRDEEILAVSTVPVDLLARNEWGGLASLPEILAAFVMPNHPATEQLLRPAADLMAQWTGDAALNGYQSKDPRRAYLMAGAVYGTLQKLALTYINPPASFEDQGQRVRLPDRVLETRMATCLDVALLAAGCLEQAGLNPLIVIVQGHAFSGVWLREEDFPEPAIDDVLRLRKRVDLNEIAVFDPTGVTAKPSLPFEQAVAAAKRHLAASEGFLCAIDIRRARKGRIRPLPERVAAPGAPVEPEEAPRADGVEPAAPDVSTLTVGPEPEVGEETTSEETPATRLDRWRRKLLDLSLRNRLLNFRETKKTLPLLCTDLAQLEDMLAGGARFKVRARPSDLGDRDPRDPNAHLRRTGQEAVKELLRDELKSRRLCADLAPGELDARLVETYRAARRELEEGGASALYLGIGFLSWYETEKSSQRRLAPILLLPLELHRKSVLEGFTLCQSDDEPRINVTLLELLKQDHDLVIPGLDPLPEDESGLDVAGILRSVRNAVRDIDRWDVVDEAWIGLFSFTKFLMWRDLSQRIDALKKNPVVDHLVNRPNEPFDAGGEFPRAECLDDERDPSGTFCPLPADSSQLAAVFAAAEGRSFVLEGPPGTGKSQTITNLIAHCLTKGKTVLFVSEKMAALNVVHRRLVSVGIGRFCLELHSNKAHKREIVEQLGEALQRLGSPGEEGWEREARRLTGLRNELNAYVRALHGDRLTGDTVFRATSRLIGLRDVARVDLSWPEPDALDAEEVASLRDLVERLSTAGAACGEVRGHAWGDVRKEEWTPTWERDVHRAIAALRDATEALADHAKAASEPVGLGDGGWSLNDLQLVRELTLLLMDTPAPPVALLVQPGWDEIESRIGTWIDQGRSRDRLRAEIQERFQLNLVQLDLDALRVRLIQAEASFWPLSWWRRRPVQKAVNATAQQGKKATGRELASVLDSALALREVQRKMDAESAEARGLLGRYWNDGEADWDRMAELSGWVREVRALSARAAGHDLERGLRLRETWARLATEGQELLRGDGSLRRNFLAFGEALETFDAMRGRVVDLLNLDVERTWVGNSGVDCLGRVRSSVSAWHAGKRELRDWCAWRRARSEAMKNNLSPLVEAYEKGTVHSTELEAVFERSFTEWWIGAVVCREPVLSTFFSPEHELKIKHFRELDDVYLKLTRGVIQARLEERLPAASSSVLPNSEMGVLRREMGKRRRHIPIRQLIQKIPNLLPKLKPCLLMSPMSIAQFLDADFPPFDVVVFDEASQIPVWDAVGAIARGRQAVIVGDPKQLPPTNFFQRSDDEEEEEEGVVEDLESILDECIGAQLPWLSLDWHYRSRHESLITFSNYHYYGNRLLTFPSPVREGLGVSLCHVSAGVYDRGRSRTNRAEAEEVVAEVLRRLRTPGLSDFSIGVVTFSLAQQTLIEDLLDQARAEDPRLDPFFSFSEDRYEPVFVKNLENVQGDERDVILFSICYGPDLSGRVSMNFGPMNRDGGERRLNVAISRARREVLVFSTLRSGQINLASTRARGVRDLRSFLEYAERGPSAIGAALELDPDADFESPFEEAAFDALIDRGWEVHKQVGSGGYRIDLAIVDPEAPGRYRLGVECDGANYHRAKTARDRDKLREGVLRELGWKLHRIWSTDWWTNPDRETQKLEAALERARDETHDPTPQPTTEEPIPGTGGSHGPPVQEGSLLMAAPGRIERTPPFDDSAPEHEVYRPATLRFGGTQEDFYQAHASSAIRSRLVEVVRLEGPISLSLAARRVAAAWGFERVRAPAQERIWRLIPKNEVRLEVGEAGAFLWPRELAPAEYRGFRVPGASGDSVRGAEDLPVEEIANAALHLLESHMSAPMDELVRETARLFGFQRVGHLVETRMRTGLQHLVQRAAARIEGDAVVLAG